MKRTAIRFDRSLINPKGDSVRYLEVSMDSPGPERRSKRKRAPMDLALVIDRSGSMRGEPLAAAREAARGVAQQLRAKDTSLYMPLCRLMELPLARILPCTLFTPLQTVHTP